MIIDLKSERSNYIVRNLSAFKPSTHKSLKDAPLMIRRMGLPLALAYWAKDGDQTLVLLISKWIFKHWKMITGKVPPQTLSSLLVTLEQLDNESRTLRSAVEIEAEQLLQTAKMISVAITKVSEAKSNG